MRCDTEGGVGRDLSLGRVREPTRWLEREVTTRTWGEIENAQEEGETPEQKRKLKKRERNGEPIIAYTASTCTQLSSRTAWPLKIGSIGCSETSVTNYKLRSLNISEERWPRLFTCHRNSQRSLLWALEISVTWTGCAE